MLPQNRALHYSVSRGKNPLSWMQSQVFWPHECETGCGSLLQPKIEKKIVYSTEQLLSGIFTVRCYAENGYATVCRLSVRLSNHNGYLRDHIGYNTLKITLRLISLR